MVFIACSAENNNYTISMLIGTKWSIEDDSSVNIIEFTPTTINKTIVFKDDNDSAYFQWKYYLTDTIVSHFDTTKVGISNIGKYITYCNKQGIVFSEEIIKLNEDSIVLFWKTQKEFIGGKDNTRIFKRVK